MTAESDIERQMRRLLRAIRPRFERWAVDNGFDIEPVDKDEPESRYKSPVTQAAFEGWIGALFDQANNETGHRGGGYERSN
jgi:hypothetical protein